MKVIICGSPHWNFDTMIERDIVDLRAEAMKSGTKLMIIHGGEPGAESTAHRICRDQGIDVIVHEAVKRRGPDSLFRRNSIMLSYHNPDLVVCYAPVVSESAVVSDMLIRARARGCDIRAVDRKSLDARYNPTISGR